MPAKAIKWSKVAHDEFRVAIEYIMNDSVQNAENLEKKLRNKLHTVLEYPDMYPPDKYKSDNDGSYRAFNLFSYRVSYRVKDDCILILRIRHSSRKPLQY